MLKRFVTCAAIAATASLCLAQGAHAATLTFDDIDLGAAPYGHYPNDFYNGGLHFTDYDMDVLSAPIAAPTTGNNGQFFIFGSGDLLEPLVITLDDGGLGGAFSLQSLRLALGDFNLAPAGTFDRVTITGVRATNCNGNCANPTAVTFDVGYGFQLFNLAGFNNLSSLTIGQQMIGVPGAEQVEPGFLAVDDLRYVVGDSDTAVPEPATWAMMLLGFGGLGLAMRRRRAGLITAAI